MKKYRLFLLALIFIATLLGSFHYHDDGTSQEDCQVCIVINHFSVADIPDTFSLQAIALFYFVSLFAKHRYISVLPIKNNHSRAPPSFS